MKKLAITLLMLAACGGGSDLGPAAQMCVDWAPNMQDVCDRCPEFAARVPASIEHGRSCTEAYKTWVSCDRVIDVREDNMPICEEWIESGACPNLNNEPDPGFSACLNAWIRPVPPEDGSYDE